MSNTLKLGNVEIGGRAWIAPMTGVSDLPFRKAASRLGNTVTGTLKGKIGYMAPEQVQGGDLDRRCDVWAAGVIAWQLITGKKLFSGDNDAAVLLQIATKPPPRVKALAITKVDSADHIRLIAEVVSELEAERGMTVGATQLTAMIETPAAWFQR